MGVKCLTEMEIPEVVKVARGVFDYCLRSTIANEQSIRCFEDYVTEENLTRRLNDGSLFLWGIYEQGHLVAVSGMQSEGHITMLYVLPFLQRHGFGKELLHTMRVFAGTKLNLSWVTVNAMPEWTANYFRKHKFSVMLSNAQAPGQYTALMAKTLNEVSYEPKELHQGWVIGITVAAILLSCGVAGGYVAFWLGLV